MKNGFFSPKVRLSGLVTCGAVVGGAFTAAGFLGRWWWRFEQIGHFRVQFFRLIAGASLFLLLRRRRRAAALAGFLALLNLSLIVPLYLGRPPAPVPGGAPRYRALLFNVNNRNRSYEKVRRYIREARPDFAAIEEASDAWRVELGRLSPEYATVQVLGRDDSFGIAFLARRPVKASRLAFLGEADVPSVVARLDLGGKELTVIATHPLPPSSASYARLRNGQLREVARAVAAEPRPLMILGDLNMSSWSPFFRDLVRDTGLRDSRKGFGVQASWPTGLPWLWIPIDHALVSPEIRILSRAIGPDLGSDHYPLLVDFALPGGK